jgi:DNA-binding transcriptional LysR family regulator
MGVNHHGRWQNLTPHLARVAIVMRKHRSTEEASKELRMRREAICIAIRAIEAIVEARLFIRTQNRKEWHLLDTPAAKNAWTKIQGAFEQC